MEAAEKVEREPGHKILRLSVKGGINLPLLTEKNKIGKYFLECSITPFVKQLRTRASVLFENQKTCGAAAARWHWKNSKEVGLKNSECSNTSFFTLSNYMFDVPLHSEDLIVTSKTREIHFCLVQDVDVGSEDELDHQEVRKLFVYFFFLPRVCSFFLRSHISQRDANNFFFISPMISYFVLLSFFFADCLHVH